MVIESLPCDEMNGYELQGGATAAEVDQEVRVLEVKVRVLREPPRTVEGREGGCEPASLRLR